MRVEGDVVKVGIEAPSDVPVHRKEVYEEIQRSNQGAVIRQSTPLPKPGGVTAETTRTAKPKTGLAATKTVSPNPWCQAPWNETIYEAAAKFRQPMPSKRSE